MLVSSLHWTPEEFGSKQAKECHSNRIGELDDENEGKQGKSCFLLSDLEWVFLLQILGLRKSLRGCPAARFSLAAGTIKLAATGAITLGLKMFTKDLGRTRNRNVLVSGAGQFSTCNISILPIVP